MSFTHTLIIGAGTVGLAYAQAIGWRGRALPVAVSVFDPHGPQVHLPGIQWSATLAPLLTDQPTLVLICVPTPSGMLGRCDTSAVQDALNHLQAHRLAPASLVAIKSTVPPGTTRYLGARYPGLHLVHNPEFLTATNAAGDALEPTRIVIGGTRRHAATLHRFYRRTLGHECPIFTVTPETAEASKYACNAMLAARIAHFNELSDWAGAQGAGVQALQAIVGSDPRIGPLYASRGYGGACLPKDVRHLVTRHPDSLPLLHAVHQANRQRLHATT